MYRWEREVQEILARDKRNHSSNRWAANSLRVVASLALIIAVGGYTVAPRLPVEESSVLTPVPTAEPFRAPRKPYYDYYRVAPMPVVASPSPQVGN